MASVSIKDIAARAGVSFQKQRVLLPVHLVKRASSASHVVRPV